MSRSDHVQDQEAGYHPETFDLLLLPLNRMRRMLGLQATLLFTLTSEARVEEAFREAIAHRRYSLWWAGST